MADELVERILSRVVKDGGGCWNSQWSGNGRGYTQMKVPGRSRQVHRLMYEEIVGPIPSGMHIDHLCNNRRCCNPAHLEAVTPAENNRRANERHPLGHVRATTHCPRGHEYTEADRKPCGRKQCRACLKEDYAARTADPEFRLARARAEKARYQARKAALAI